MVSWTISLGMVWACYGQEPAATQPAEGEAGKPVITVDNALHDFGSIKAGPQLNHSFKVSNTGNAELKITAVKPDCGCTIAGKYPDSLKPGESGLLPFTLNTNNIHGRFSKRITVMSNDPATPQLKLSLDGEVKRDIDIMPQGAYFGPVYGNEPKVQTLKITNNTEKPLQLALDPFASMGPFRFELKETEPGKVFHLKVSTAPPYTQAGVLRDTATIMTNVASQRQIQVTAMANPQERLDLQPAEVMVMPPASQPSAQTAQTMPAVAANTKRILRFSNNGDKPVKITEAKADDPALTVTVQEQVAGKMYIIQVEIPVTYAVPAQGSKIVVKTDDADKPELHVPIRAIPARNMPAESMVGLKAPTFALSTMTKKPVSNEALTGSITVLDFFAPNCLYCKKQMPRVDAIRPDYEAKGVRFAYICQKMGPKTMTQEEITDILKQIGVKGEVAIDEGNKVGTLFRTTSYPTMMIVGKTGTVEAANVGNMADLDTRLKGQLDALLAGKPVPPELLPPKTPTPPTPPAPTQGG